MNYLQALIQKRSRGGGGVSTSGFSLPELLIASFILALAILGSVRMTSTALQGMGRSKTRGHVDIEIARHIEELRAKAFEFLCTQGCGNDQLTQALTYDLTTLKPLCATKGLGQAFLGSLSDQDKPLSFTTGTPPVDVSAKYEDDGNKVHITYTAETKPSPLVVTTTLVPHAQGWCP